MVYRLFVTGIFEGVLHWFYNVRNIYNLDMDDNFAFYLLRTRVSPEAARRYSQFDGDERLSISSLDLSDPEVEAEKFLWHLNRKSIVDGNHPEGCLGDMEEIKINNIEADDVINITSSIPDTLVEDYNHNTHTLHSENQNAEFISRYDHKDVVLETHSTISQLNDSDQNTHERNNSNNRNGMQSELNLTKNFNDNKKSDQNINYSIESISNNREVKSESPIIQLSNVNDIQSLQEKYSNAIEEFRVFRAKLALNMERNLIRTEQFNLKKAPNRYRSQEDLSKSSFDVSATRPFETTYRQLNRYASQEQLNRKKNEFDDRPQTADYFKASPTQKNTFIISNNNHIENILGKPVQLKTHEYPINNNDLRQHQVQLRDQAARSNFERYLRGSAVRHQTTLDSADISKRDSSIFEEHVDIGYGGSGSTSPNQGENIMLTSDQLSSRSGSINSHHSQASSAIASVDSGVRMSFVGQHNSLVVVAIDFGTTFSGYAFSFTRDASSIHMMRRWEGGDPGVTNQKTPTTLLLKPDGTFHSFGFGARDFYHDLDASDSKKWLYFDKFKMSLHCNKVCWCTFFLVMFGLLSFVYYIIHIHNQNVCLHEKQLEGFPCLAVTSVLEKLPV